MNIINYNIRYNNNIISIIDINMIYHNIIYKYDIIYYKI